MIRFWWKRLFDFHVICSSLWIYAKYDVFRKRCREGKNKSFLISDIENVNAVSYEEVNL